MTNTTAGGPGAELAGGRYTLKSRLPSSVTAEFYCAWDRHLQADVAIKFPSVELLRDASFAARFRREIRSLVMLAHPRIVPVLDSGEHAGRPYVVLQHLGGGTLRDRQRGPGGVARPLPVASLGGWLAGIADALDFLHAQRFVHRDVKPDSVVFDGHGNAFLSDFGVIKALAGDGSGDNGGNLTQKGMALGTLQYMAPEVFRGQAFDGRADQYALAVTVYEVLAGRRPFDGDNAAAIMIQQVNQLPPPLHEVVPGVPAGVSLAVARALAKDPAQRFPDCRSFAQAVLAGAASLLPVLAPLALKPAQGPPPLTVQPVDAPAAAAGPEVRLECPLCQEVLLLSAGFRGRLECPSCRSILILAPDLRRLTVASQAHVVTVAPRPTEADPPPVIKTLDVPVSAPADQGTSSFSLIIDGPEDPSSPPALPPEGAPHDRFMLEVSEPPSPVAFTTEPALVGSVPPPAPGDWAYPEYVGEALPWQPEVRGKGGKVMAVVCLGLLLLGGLAAGAYFAFRGLLDNGGQADGGQRPPELLADLTVSPQEDSKFKTLADGLKAAQSNAIIHVRPGVYRESLILDKPVQIMGDGPTDAIILESSGGPTVRIQTDGPVTLQGLSLRGPGVALEIGQGKAKVLACELTSGGEAAVVVWGARTEPTFLKCLVHDSKGVGMLFHTGASGNLEICTFIGNQGAAVEIRQQAQPTLRKCILNKGKSLGLLVQQGGKGLLEDCSIEANALDGVVIKERSEPVLRRCTIQQGRQNGVIFANKGQGLVEDCTIAANALAGVVIEGESDPTVRGCKIMNGQEQGVVVHHQGAGRLDGCTMSGNKLAGVEIRDGGTTKLTACKIQNGLTTGVLCQNKGEGRLENCFISGNAGANVAVQQGAAPTLLHCQVYNGKMQGVTIFTGGRATLEDCDVYGNGSTGVVIASTNPSLLRQCRIHDGKQWGLWFYSGGKATVENCNLYANTFAAVEVHGGADPQVRKCQLYNGKQSGISVDFSGKGKYVDCDIHDNDIGIQVQRAAAPIFQRCKVYGSRQAGAFILQKGLGQFDSCHFYANGLAGVEVRDASNPAFTNCQMYGGKTNGVYVHLAAKGVFTDCDIRDNTSSGVSVIQAATPSFVRCRIHGGKSTGIGFFQDGRGTFERCEVYANALVGIEIATQSNPLLRQCRIYDGKSSGVYVHNAGKGIFENCTISGNAIHGVQTATASEPVLRKCDIRGQKVCGILAYDNGKGTIEDCTIADNALNGVEMSKRAELLLRKCDIRQQKGAGILASDNGKGTIEDCDIKNNSKSGIASQSGAVLAVRRCHINGNDWGVVVYKKSTMTVTDSDLTGNTHKGKWVEKDGTLNSFNNKE